MEQKLIDPVPHKGWNTGRNRVNEVHEGHPSTYPSSYQFAETVNLFKIRYSKALKHFEGMRFIKDQRN